MADFNHYEIFSNLDNDEYYAMQDKKRKMYEETLEKLNNLLGNNHTLRMKYTIELSNMHSEQERLYYMYRLIKELGE